MRSLRPGLVLLLVGLLAGPASAYGPGGHREASEQAWEELIRLPGFARLRGDAAARRCFLYGSVAPDVRSVAPHGQALRDLIARIEAVSAVKDVRLDATGLGPLGFDTHDPRLALHAVDRARATGAPELLAFALGTLAHGCQDRDEQTFTMQRLGLEGRAGDPGVEAEHAGHGRDHAPGAELELVCEAMREARQPRRRLIEARDAGRELAEGGFLGLRRTARSLALRERLVAFHYDACRSYAQARAPGAAVIGARGFANAAALLEAAGVLLPAALGKESFGRAARVFKSRYVDLRWWADILYVLADVLSRALTLGTGGVTDLTALALNPCGRIRSAGADQPLLHLVWARARGGREWERALARHGHLAEARRLVQSGLLEPDRHADSTVGRAMLLDLAERGLASRWVDWPTSNPRLAPGVAAQSFLLPPAPPPPPTRPSWLRFRAQDDWRRALAAWHARWDQAFEARAAGFVVADVRWVDAVSGAPVTSLQPGDAGRALRAEVTLQGLSPRASRLLGPGPLALEVRVLEDVVAGPDRLLARTPVNLPADRLDPLRYGRDPVPVVSATFTTPMAAGTRGHHVELLYEGQRVFTTAWDEVAARGATAPHYRDRYGSYDPRGLASLGW